MFSGYIKLNYLMLLGVTLKRSGSWFNRQPLPLSATLPPDTTSNESCLHTHSHKHTRDTMHSCNTLTSNLSLGHWSSERTSSSGIRSHAVMCGSPNNACDSDGVWVCVCVFFVCVCVPMAAVTSSSCFCIVLLSTCWSGALSRGGQRITAHTHIYMWGYPHADTIRWKL